MAERSFADHFSGHANRYAKYRPTYPPELFRALAVAASSPGLVWDVACGNGQASVGLASHFDRVVATDASSEQLARAAPHERVDYRCEAAEAPSFPDATSSFLAAAS